MQNKNYYILFYFITILFCSFVQGEEKNTCTFTEEDEATTGLFSALADEVISEEPVIPSIPVVENPSPPDSPVEPPILSPISNTPSSPSRPISSAPQYTNNGFFDVSAPHIIYPDFSLPVPSIPNITSIGETLGEAVNEETQTQENAAIERQIQNNFEQGIQYSSGLSSDFETLKSYFASQSPRQVQEGLERAEVRLKSSTANLNNQSQNGTDLALYELRKFKEESLFQLRAMRDKIDLENSRHHSTVLALIDKIGRNGNTNISSQILLDSLTDQQRKELEEKLKTMRKTDNGDFAFIKNAKENLNNGFPTCDRLRQAAVFEESKPSLYRAEFFYVMAEWLKTKKFPKLPKLDDTQKKLIIRLSDGFNLIDYENGIVPRKSDFFVQRDRKKDQLSLVKGFEPDTFKIQIFQGVRTPAAVKENVVSLVREAKDNTQRIFIPGIYILRLKKNSPSCID